MDEIFRGDVDPEFTAMMLREMLAIARQAPGHGPKSTLGESLSALGITPQEAEALALKRVSEKLGHLIH